jgi:hypothetical protein
MRGSGLGRLGVGVIHDVDVARGLGARAPGEGVPDGVADGSGGDVGVGRACAANGVEDFEEPGGGLDDLEEVGGVSGVVGGHANAR